MTLVYFNDLQNPVINVLVQISELLQNALTTGQTYAGYGLLSLFVSITIS